MKELSDNMVEAAKAMGGTTSSSRRWALRRKSKELDAAETLLTEKILERRVCSSVERAKVIAGESPECVDALLSGQCFGRDVLPMNFR